MVRAALTPSKTGAPGSLNMSAFNGRCTPSFKQFMLDSTDRLHYAVGVIEYKAPLSTGGQPRQYCAMHKTVWNLEDGDVNDDVDDAASTPFDDVVQGMAIWDVPDLGDPSTFTQGSAGLIVSFGSGEPVAGETGLQYRRLDVDANSWTAASDALGIALSDYATAWQMVKAGPDLYAVTDAGVAGLLGDYRISKCKAGNNPVLRASWGNGFEVGGPEWMITGLAAIGNSVVVGKPDGLYYFDDLTKRFENVLKHFEINPHALNGKCTASVTGGVVYTTNDGGVYFFDGVSSQEISPHKFWNLMSRDIGNSRITAVCDRGDTIEMFQELAYQSTQNAGLIINKVTAGTATDITNSMVDGRLDTGGDVSSLANGGFIDIWSEVPFEGAIFYVTRNQNTNEDALFEDVLYSSATDTFSTQSGGMVDGTKISTGGSLSYVAFPASASAGVVMHKYPGFGALMQPVLFTYAAGGTNIATAMYGMRIELGGGAFSSTVEIDEIEIIPYRAGMPSGGIYSASTNFTSRNNSGLIGHIVSMKRKGNGFVPRDKYAVNSFPGVWAMAAHNGRLGQGDGEQNLGPALVGWGRQRVFAISESPTRDEIRTRRPLLAAVNSTMPGPLEQIAFDWDNNAPERLKRLKAILIDTRFVQPDDRTELFAQFDDHDIVSLGVFAGGPINATVNQAQFRYLNLWIGFDQGSNGGFGEGFGEGFDQGTLERANAPQFVEPYILEFDIEDITGQWARDNATPARELT